MNILVGHEESQAVTKELRKLGHNAYSCDIKPCSGGHPEWHIQCDVELVIDGWRPVVFAGDCDEYGNCPRCEIDYADCSCPGPTQEGIEFMEKDSVLYGRPEGFAWGAGLFFPDCTYLTISAEWAYKYGPYHQNVKPGTLVGKERREARSRAVAHVWKLWRSDIPMISIENPVGRLSTLFRPPTQTIQPYEFGDDASKRTCLWLRGLPLLKGTKYIQPRMVDGKPRWGNQTDSGQNKLSPGPGRAAERSKTYPGIAKAMAEQWFTNYQQNLFYARRD